MDEFNMERRITQEEVITTEPVTLPEHLKTTYGKVYQIGMTIPVDDEVEKAFSYFFRRPSAMSYDRYINSAAKIGMVKASKAFMLDSVVAEDRDRLVEEMEEFPGIAITIGNKLTEILGLTNAVNLKKL